MRRGRALVVNKSTRASFETRNLELPAGAFHAVNAVNLKVEAGTIHTIIGPNGAGKTSLFHCLTGERQATAVGAIHFDGNNLMRKPAHARVAWAWALSRSPSACSRTSRRSSNPRLAAQGRDGALGGLNFWRRVDSKREHLEMADQVLERLQLSARADTLAGELLHGQQRVLEVGMSICSKPKLLMLDEPTSGMGIDTIPIMTQLIADLGRDHGAVDRTQHEHRHAVHQPTHHRDEPRPGSWSSRHPAIRARR